MRKKKPQSRKQRKRLKFEREGERDTAAYKERKSDKSSIEKMSQKE